ncbi:histidine kinase [Fulvivirga maritima]|uniref:sensor histidine kinase n=1 Tax=Fulvivirga maritima TaxID=2904247 RepID=UPI001F21E618|nr:histidine kinase [Fulvivirga maritima]UII26363.1 histidine kinase [Fulvivirga maritima]
MKQLSGSTIKTMKILFHVAFIAVILFQLLNRGIHTLPEDGLFFLTSDPVENFLCAAIAYALFYYVFKLNGVWAKLGLMVLFVIILGLLAGLKDFRIHDLVSFNVTFGYFTSFLGKALLFYLLLYFINRLDALNHYRKLETELNAAKEQLLRNQLHPHFLFNALNSLYSLSLKSNPQVSEYILKLSGMMRYLTDEIQLKKVPLSRELEFIEQYLAVEKLRFGREANIQFEPLNMDGSGVFIEPFLLIPLVENAFKHGFYINSKDAFVHIKVEFENDVLMFSVANSMIEKKHFQTNNRRGKGLENLNERLQLLYSKKACLQVKEQDGLFKAQLKIILN